MDPITVPYSVPIGDFGEKEGEKMGGGEGLGRKAEGGTVVFVWPRNAKERVGWG